MKKPAPLFDQTTIKKRFSKITITEAQKNIAHSWIEKIKDKKLEKESENYFKFRDEILRDLLGYPENKIRYEEQRVEFSVADNEDSVVTCIECKGTKTKDLFANQHYIREGQESPFIQTYLDMGRFPGISYGVCTNYKNFVLLIYKLGTTKCHEFNFLDIEKSDEKLQEFIGIFSYENLILKKIHDNLYKDSIMAEKKITEEFYQIYSETRKMLIQTFIEKNQVNSDKAIHFAQLYLNRLIFIFFLSDNGFLEQRLFAEETKKLLGIGQCTAFSQSIWNFTLNLFHLMDKGQKIPYYFGYNGGLFREEIPPNINFFDIVEPQSFKSITQKTKIAHMQNVVGGLRCPVGVSRSD